ncbi:hypothetical protein JMJ35_008717 [Cladonia borealis]|uniref:Inositol monophosphatase n=1 Tax=Cladonia borealis TaxID=184061 RepID=A0AA39QU51_9LECA|nr:hypothetical protein JMJ35_008717 [Cladonia borealis]
MSSPTPNLQDIHDTLYTLALRAGTMITTANPLLSPISTKKKLLRPRNDPTFIVDPIDGTTNFVHAHPYISISMAFAYEGRPLVGVVYNPFRQELYHAIHGKGAFLTAPSIPTSQPPLPEAGETMNVEAVYEV